MLSLQEQAQMGLREIEASIVGLLKEHSDGLTNAQIARSLGIETGEPSEHRNMLTWSIIGRLISSGRVEREKTNGRVVLRLIRT